MPLFNSDDYNNLHPELEQTPAGMTDNSYTIAMCREYVSWLTSLVARWPESSGEVDGAFSCTPLWSRVQPRHPEDDPYLTTLLVAGGSLGRLMESLHRDTRSDALGHLGKTLANHLRRSAIEPNQVVVNALRGAVCALVGADPEEGLLLFLMRVMDIAHDDDGAVEVETAVQVAWLITIGVVAILTGSENPGVGHQLLAVLEAQVEALAAEPILPYFEGDNE